MNRFSKNEIRRAGHVFVGGETDKERLAIALERVNYWRGIHVEALGRLLREAESLTHSFADLLVAGRIKKQKTIIDKLQRDDNVKDLDTMYDIAGCRIVVPSLEELREVVNLALRSPYCDQGRTKDYIAHPKRDGYRGVHVIYHFDDLECGHALRAELQIRTEQQHAWATAVEMYDSAAHTRLKFEDDDSIPFWFFKRASALIDDLEAGRVVDAGLIRAMGEHVSEGAGFYDVVALLKEANNAAYLIGTEYGISIDDYCLIDLSVVEQILSVSRLESTAALDTYFRKERELAEEEHDLVLVKGFSLDGLQRLYPNYFGNIDLFVNLIERHADCFL